MKKLLVLFGVMALLPMASFAYYYENETADIDVLKAQGYSDSALMIVDLTNDINKGQNGTYTRRYQQKSPKGKLGNAYTYLKRYVDPFQDDGKFGEHQINFTNTWTGENAHYSSALEEKSTVENL